MIVTLALAALIVVGVLVEAIVPGNPLYHAGWFNVLLAALVIALALRMRAVLRTLATPRARAGATIAAFGVAIVGFAGVASGLLGPDARTIVGAPGERVRADDLGGALQFPLAQSGTSGAVALVRGERALAIDHTRYVGAFVLRPVPRTVVEISASDARDAHLTITQPSGAAFLSPVLLMQNRQTISNLDVPFDSFALPAAHVVVKAVYFPPAIAAQFHNLDAPPGSSVVLFDAENESGAEVKNGIGAAVDGGSVTVAGLTLRPRVFTYPAVEVLAIPHVDALLVGLLFIVGGILTARVRPGRMGES
ncbi:MAG: hypothetical protein KGN02_05400 [bacterium]|nr:hypothetical protein [bacterium]